MSKELKKRGFNFVGSTICYAFMQATGMVNDHAVECFRYAGQWPRNQPAGILDSGIVLKGQDLRAQVVDKGSAAGLF